MKSFFSCIAIVIVIVLSSSHYASSLMCYDCNSRFDARCGEEFDPFHLGVIDCSLQDPPDHLHEVVPTVCRVIKMEIYGKVRISRRCGYLNESSFDDRECQRRTGTHDVFTTYCSCTTDLCNRSVNEHSNGLLLAFVAMLLCLML